MPYSFHVRPALIVVGLLLSCTPAHAGNDTTVTLKNCTADKMDIVTRLVEDEDSDTPQRKHFDFHHTVNSEHSVTVKASTRRLTIEARQGVIARPTRWEAVPAKNYGIYFDGHPNHFGHYKGHKLKPLNRGLCDGKS